MRNERLTVGKCYSLKWGVNTEWKFYVGDETNHTHPRGENLPEDTYSYFCTFTNKEPSTQSMDAGRYLWTNNFTSGHYSLSDAVELVGEELIEFKSTLNMFK